jgi:hypothetical protein
MKTFLRFAMILALGCGSRSSGEPAQVAMSLPPAEVPTATGSPSPAAPADDATPTANLSSSLTASLAFDRQIIRNAAVQLEDDDPVAMTEQATRLAVDSGGFLLDGHIESSSGVLTSRVVVRVPGSAFERTLTAVHALGALQKETISGQDVTEELVDTEARLRALRALQARLLALLERTGGLTDLLQVEQELARVGGDVERYEGRLRYLQERTAMATIELTVSSPAPVPVPFVYEPETVSSRFRDAFSKSLHVCVDVIETGIVLLGFVLPTAAFVAMALFPWIWFRRRRLQARAAHAAAGVG